MAEELASSTHWSTAQTRQQFRAIAWLRWRILANSFRRKGSTSELVGIIIVYPLFGILVLAFVFGAGTGAYFIAAKGILPRLSLLLWGIFILCQLLNIQLGQPGTTFDPTQLIRFPLGARTYVVIRLFFGLLTPANIVGTLMSLAVAVGVIAALPGLWFYALLAMAVFAAANVLFSRMIFAWVDRWLSTRRAREVFGGVIFAVSLGIQWANFTFNPAYNRHGHSHGHGVTQQRLSFVQSLYRHAHPFLGFLPPELTASALVAAHRAAALPYLGYTAGCALFAAAFLGVFALRMNTEYRGENLSDAANGTPKASKAAVPVARRAPAAVNALAAPSAPAGGFSLPGPVVAMLGKEFLYIRRTMGILYGLVMPIFLVLVLASRVASRSNASWVFPAAVAYTLLAVGPLSYNAFGLDATGAQFYFLAPVRMKDILLAKNLFSFTMAFVEIVAVFGIISYVARVPSPFTAIAAVLWAVGTLAVNMIFGNRRSITTPKKINPQRMVNKQASQVSGFISLGVMAASGGIASAAFAGAIWFQKEWLLVPVFALFAAGGVFAYMKSLAGVDAFARDHREELLTELTKQS
jgi:ABC-2 type transport system permease protein